MRIFCLAIWMHFLTLRFQAVCGFFALASGCIFWPLDFKQYADFLPWHLAVLFGPEISSSMRICCLGICMHFWTLRFDIGFASESTPPQPELKKWMFYLQKHRFLNKNNFQIFWRKILPKVQAHSHWIASECKCNTNANAKRMPRENQCQYKAKANANAKLMRMQMQYQCQCKANANTEPMLMQSQCQF